MTRIESTAIIEPGVEIGDNCYIGHFAVIRPGVIIGNNTEIRAHCFVAAKARIGSHTNVNQFTNICRDTIIEDHVFIGPGVIMTNTKKIAFRRDYDDISQAPYIEHGVRIGGGVVICPNVKIAENCLIGAGSVVTKDTIPRAVYVGNPAEYIKWVKKEELI